MVVDGIEVLSIAGFSNYAITKDGRVWSKPRKYATLQGQWLIPYIDSDGYSRIYLCQNKKRHNCFVHRLVLETYQGICPKGMECRHLNGNEQDNRLENLV